MSAVVLPTFFARPRNAIRRAPDGAERLRELGRRRASSRALSRGPERVANARASGRVPAQEVQRRAVVAGDETVPDQELRGLGEALRPRAPRPKTRWPCRKRARSLRPARRGRSPTSVPEALATLTTRSARRPLRRGFDRRRAWRRDRGRRSVKTASAKPRLRARSAAAAARFDGQDAAGRADGSRGRPRGRGGPPCPCRSPARSRPAGRRAGRPPERPRRRRRPARLLRESRRASRAKSVRAKRIAVPRDVDALRRRRGRRRSTRGAGESASARRAWRWARRGRGCRRPDAADRPRPPRRGACRPSRSPGSASSRARRTIRRDLVGDALAVEASASRIWRKEAESIERARTETAISFSRARGVASRRRATWGRTPRRFERAVEPERDAGAVTATEAGRRCGAVRRSLRRSSSAARRPTRPARAARRGWRRSRGRTTLAPLAIRARRNPSKAP